MRIVFASTLAVLAASASCTPAWGQPHEGLTRCGARPPMRYAAVFDASSSVRVEPALRAETEASYRKLLGLFAGLLCTEDRLAVYAFAANSTTRMDPLVEIYAAFAHVLLPERHCTTGDRSPLQPHGPLSGHPWDLPRRDLPNGAGRDLRGSWLFVIG